MIVEISYVVMIISHKLKTCILQVASIEERTIRISAERRNRHLKQHIRSLLHIEVHAQIERIAQKCEVNTNVGLSTCLPLDILITLISRYVSLTEARTKPPLSFLISTNKGERSCSINTLITILSPTCAQLQVVKYLAKRRILEEFLITDSPSQRQ